MEYQKSNRFFAQIQRGFEPISVEELEQLGASDCKPGYLGIYFNCDIDTLYKINYSARTLIRVLAPLFSFKCHSDKTLYKEVARFNWDRLFSPEKSFMVSASVSGSKLKHSQFAALKTKDAIADYFREKHKRRPSVDRENPDIVLNLNLNNNQALVSLDLTGFPMYKRGYRIQTVPAPLTETLAAAIIKISGWRGENPFVDPFCGSGTLLAEAVMSHCGIPSGYFRKKFGFFNMPEFNKSRWLRVKHEQNQIKALPKGLIYGTDISKNAITAARTNLSLFEDDKHVQIKRKDFRNLEGFENSTIVSNLPYGKRIGNNTEIEELYKAFGDFLKQRCQGSKAYLLCGSTSLVKKVGLRTSRKIPLYNGPIEVRLIELELY